MAEEKRVIYFYEKDAEKYEEERFVNGRGKYQDRAQKDIVFNMINSWKNLDILEVGCGTGRFSIEISKRGSIIIALDSSLSMLKKLKKRVNIKDNKIELVFGSGHNLSFKDNSFDGLIEIKSLGSI
jgi:ubiquinone/menaquinone biosynthesis C-methylase UbiE